MSDQKIFISMDSYSNYLDAMIRLSLLRDILWETPPEQWAPIIRRILDIAERKPDSYKK